MVWKQEKVYFSLDAKHLYYLLFPFLFLVSSSLSYLYDLYDLCNLLIDITMTSSLGYIPKRVGFYLGRERPLCIGFKPELTVSCLSVRWLVCLSLHHKLLVFILSQAKSIFKPRRCFLVSCPAFCPVYWVTTLLSGFMPSFLSC